MPRGNPTQHQNDYWSSYIGSTVVIPIDGTVHVNSTPLRAGHHILYCRETGIYVRQNGPGGSPGVTSADFLLEKGTYRDLTVDDANNGYLYVTTADGLAGALRVTYASDET